MDRLGKSGIPFVFIIDYRCARPLLWGLEEVPQGILYNFRGFANVPSPFFTGNDEVIFYKKPIPYDRYLASYQVALKGLKRGESFLINLSAPTPIETNLTIRQIFDYSTAPYRLCLREEFVCFSPEPFVIIDGRQIATYPMKGTIDASVPDAAQRVLANPKEAAEHATIVDLLRNDLSRVADKVWVEKYRYIDVVETQRGKLLQVSSEIRGELPPGSTGAFGSILVQMLPAGSVTGAPKPRTLELIEEAEQYDRGYYTGVMGYFDGKRFESSVMIRFIERTPQGLIFKSGGGITAQSDPVAEYQELIDKVYLPIPAFPSEH